MMSGALRFNVNPRHPEPRKIAQAVKVLEEGGVALYPTDTVYALGCAIEQRRTIERIYRLRQVDTRRPPALICADVRDASKYGVVTDFAYRQMRRLLPGPYTILLEATREVPKVLLDKRRTVGIRVPESPVCAALIAGLGRPLLTSSAIPPGSEAPCLDVDDGLAAWPHGIDVLIDGGPTPGQVSTVVSLIGDEITVIRAGLGLEALA
jgi:tRNA threonylcarbamoyl adenosine modification protein (Sua5/YciO/YrdC/YwlC family)